MNAKPLFAGFNAKGISAKSLLIRCTTTCFAPLNAEGHRTCINTYPVNTDVFLSFFGKLSGFIAARNVPVLNCLSLNMLSDSCSVTMKHLLNPAVKK